MALGKKASEGLFFGATMLHKKILLKNSLIILAFFCSAHAKPTTEKEYLAETISVDLPQKFKDKVDVSCLIADIKYDGDSVKILELGNLLYSTLSSHESAWTEGVIWKRFYDYLRQDLGLQLWCIGQPKWKMRQDLGLQLWRPKWKKSAQSIFFKKLSNIGAIVSPDIEQFKKDYVNLRLTGQKYILAVTRYSSVKKDNPNLKTDFPACVFSNDIAYDYGNNKYKTNILFCCKELEKFKPKWKIYPKIYCDYIVEKIKNDFDAEILVVKPINACLGRGVIIVHRDDLDETLETIFTKIDDIKNMDDNSYSYWAKDRKNEFLVEEFATSKLITLHGKKFDGKIRVVFVLSCSEGKITLKFLGSYWKAAFKSLDEQGSLTEKHKSKSHKANRVAKVSPEDAKHIQEILGDILPKMYIKMMETSENMDICFPLFKKVNRCI